MNTIIIQTFRASLVLGTALLAFTSTAFAAPMLTPASATNITETSATLVGIVSNPYKNSTEWFEFYDNGGVPTTFATQGLWNGGTFQWHLRDLNPGQTYTYRAGAMEGGVTVYTPTASFTTAVPKTASAATVSAQPNSFVGNKTSEPKVTQAKAPSTQVVVVKKEVAAPVETTDCFTRGNTAAVIGSGAGLFPNTLIGLVSLLILILVAALMGRMIYETSEKRRKEIREKEERAKKAREEETE